MPERAIHWPREAVVFITDPHFGKDASLRSQAIPMPDVLDRELERLGGLVKKTSAKKLVVLGDFYHDAESLNASQNARIKHFTQAHSNLEIILIRGNHDLKAGDPPAETGIVCQNPPFEWEPFSLVHDPVSATNTEGHYLAGHLHPGVRLRANRKEAISVPAFSISDHLIILPAFGRLTGQGGLKLGGNNRIIAIAEKDLIDLNSSSI